MLNSFYSGKRGNAASRIHVKFRLVNREFGNRVKVESEVVTGFFFFFALWPLPYGEI